MRLSSSFAIRGWATGEAPRELFQVGRNQWKGESLANQGAKQCEQRPWNRVIDESELLLVCLAELYRWPGLCRNRHSGQHRGCGHPRPGYDWGGTSMESEIGEVYLRQNKDQSEQAQLENEDAPAPSLHKTSTPINATLFHTHPNCQ